MSWQRDWTITVVDGNFQSVIDFIEVQQNSGWTDMKCPVDANGVQILSDDEIGFCFSNNTHAVDATHSFINELLEKFSDNVFHVHMYQHDGYWFDVDLAAGDYEENWQEGYADLYGEDEEEEHRCGNCGFFPGYNGAFCEEADHSCSEDDCDDCGFWFPND